MWKRVWPVLLLLCVSIGIAFFNVQKRTWLIGWDSTQSELNIPLNLSRGLSAVWQEYRGLGVTDGMAHSANLVHLVYAWILSKIVGVSYVRYAFTILAHFAGGVGMYTLLRYLGRFWQGGRVSRWIALSGALFYLLNPYTLQMFYQPLELFVTHFAALPWLTFTLIQYVSVPSRRNLWWFALANVLTLPQAHVPTLFIVWIMLAVCLLLPALLLRMRRYGKQIIMLILVSVGIHGFWGLPYIYSALNNAKNIGEAKINVLSNPEVLLRNDAYGDMVSIVKMQGFTLAFEDWNPGYKYGLQMPEWVNWWGQEWVIWVMGGMMVLAGVGIVASLMQREWWTVGVVFMYVLALGNLGARIPYVREIGLLLREHVPYYEAIFRFTFTKFALVYAFVFTILMVVGILSIYRLVRGWISLALSAVVIVGVIAVSWPVWQGQFFYHNLKLQVPSEYQNVFEFFDTQSEGRVLPLPYPDFWGWQSNEWGYRGSGFVWQGIANPTLYGSFNAWSPYNEGFYNVFSTALYGIDVSTSARERDYTKIQNVLRKYDVRYVLLDESVIAPGQDKEILRIEETKKLAEELKWEQKFQEGFLTVWDAESARQHVGTFARDFVSVPGSYTYVDADTNKVREDVVYEEQGTYVERQHVSTSARLHEGIMIYPFAELMREETANVEYGDVGIRITNNELRIGEGQELEIPGWRQGEWVEMGYSVQLTASGLQLEWEPIYTVNGQEGPRLANDQWPMANGRSGAWVQVGENKAIYVKPDEMVQGSAKLQVGEPIHIKIFDGVGKIEKVIVGDEQQCGDYRCWATPLPKAESNSLVQTITHYEGQVSPEICLDKEGDPYACTNELRQGQSPVVVTTAVHKGERYWLDWVAKDAGTKMKEPGVVVYGLDDQWTMDDGQWGTFLQNSKFQITNSVLELEVPGTARVYDFGTLGKRTIANCDVLKRGSADKLQMSTNVGQETGYTADERGAACDYAEMSQLDTRLPYFMRVVGQNVAGRSLKFFLWNTGSKRNDIETLTRQHVSTSARFDQTFSLLPWEFAGSYTLNTETRSFGQYAENRLAPVEVRYVPLEQLAKSKIQSTKSQTDDVGKIQNNLQITYTKKVGTWLYRIGIQRIADSVQPGQGLIRLSQGFDNGWVGVLVNSNSEFRIQKLEHVKVDGWANGWLVPAVNSKFQIPNPNETMIILYWPQLLEYIGFVALGFTLIFLLKKSR